MRTYIYTMAALFWFIVITSGIAESQPTPVQPSGNGTSESPYLIDSLANLYWLTQSDTAWGRYYEQTSDIDLSGSSAWDSGQGFTPIGNGTTAFTGTYDGNGHTISNLILDRVGANDYAGMFGRISTGGTIENLGLIDVNVTGYNSAGGLCGLLYGVGTTMSKCYVTGSVAGNSYIGGLAGQFAADAQAINCYSNCAVSGGSGSSLIGGLCGYNFSSIVTDCYSIGTVSGSSGLGGLVAMGVAQQPTVVTGTQRRPD